MKSKLLALLFGSALVLSACGGGGDEGGDDATTDNGEDTQTEENANGDNGTTDEGAESEGGGEGTVDVAAAEKIYKQNCAGCHATDLSGQVGPNLQTIGADYDKAGLVDIIKNGQGGMPAQNLSDDEANTVAAWLASKK